MAPRAKRPSSPRGRRNVRRGERPSTPGRAPSRTISHACRPERVRRKLVFDRQRIPGRTDCSRATMIACPPHAFAFASCSLPPLASSDARPPERARRHRWMRLRRRREAHPRPARRNPCGPALSRRPRPWTQPSRQRLRKRRPRPRCRRRPLALRPLRHGATNPRSAVSHLIRTPRRGRRTSIWRRCPSMPMAACLPLVRAACVPAIARRRSRSSAEGSAATRGALRCPRRADGLFG